MLQPKLTTTVKNSSVDMGDWGGGPSLEVQYEEQYYILKSSFKKAVGLVFI